MSLFTSSIPLRSSPATNPLTPKNEQRPIERKTAKVALTELPPTPKSSPKLKKFKIQNGPVAAKQLPLPYNSEFSNWNRSVKEDSVAECSIPQTPRKKTSQTTISRFEIVHNLLQTGYFTNKQVSEFARGSYSAVYEITESPHLVLKAYHGNTDRGFSQSALLKFMKNSLKNYRDIYALGLPVAELVNIETLESDGFFLQKKIPHEIDIQNPLHLRQAEVFFSLSVERSVAMDLQPQNLRVTSENELVLIDFIEEKDSIAIFITKACRAWVDLARAKEFSKEAGYDLLKALTSSFLDKHEVFTSAWLAEIVGE